MHVGVHIRLLFHLNVHVFLLPGVGYWGQYGGVSVGDP